MASQCKVALTLALISGLIISAGPVWTAEAPQAPHVSCPAATRYVMPEGVALPRESPDVAPADLPGSRSGYTLPPKIGFDLSVNPVPAFDQSRLPLGHVEIDRKTGQSTIDGKPLGGPSEAEAACLEAQDKPVPRSGAN